MKKECEHKDSRSTWIHTSLKKTWGRGYCEDCKSHFVYCDIKKILVPTTKRDAQLYWYEAHALSKDQTL